MRVLGHPLFSIVIPTYNRPRRLRSCLDALVQLDYPVEEFEVIVVDDGSPVPVEGVVAAFRHRLKVTLLTQPHGGPAEARNTGSAQARGTYLAFTDDDCAPTPTYLRRLEGRFRLAHERLVGGRTLNAYPNNPYSTASQLLIHYLYSYYNSVPDRALFFTSNNLAVAAEGFRAIGGFDTTYTRATAEDREFCDRWLHSGYKMYYDPEVVIYHAHELTFRTLWRQHFGYGCGAYHFRRARAQRTADRVRLEPPSFYLSLLRYPFREAGGWQGLQLAGLLAMAQVANAVGFLLESCGRAEAVRSVAGARQA